MKPRVRLLSLSYPDWNEFVTFTTEVTGRSPTRKCDKQGIEVGDVKSYIISLSDFADVDVELTLRHLSVSFLVHAKEQHLFKLLEFVPKVLSFSEDLEEGKLAIFSGTLEEWKVAIIQLSKNSKTRFLANQCYVLLQKQNLEFVFKGHSKEKQEDGTFVIK